MLALNFQSDISKHYFLYYFSDPFKRFFTYMWQNAHVNNVRCAMVCNVCFSFSKLL